MGVVLMMFAPATTAPAYHRRMPRGLRPTGRTIGGRCQKPFRAWVGPKMETWSGPVWIETIAVGKPVESYRRIAPFPPLPEKY